MVFSSRSRPSISRISADHEQRTVLHFAFTGQHAPPAMDEFAAQGALVHPPRHAVAETDEDAFLQRLVFHLAGLRVEALGFGDAQKLLEQRPDLPGGDRMNAELAADVHAKLIFARHNSMRA